MGTTVVLSDRFHFLYPVYIGVQTDTPPPFAAKLLSCEIYGKPCRHIHQTT